MRRSFLELSIAVPDHCRGTLRGKAVDRCFETVIGGLADEDVDNRMLASAATKRLTAHADIAFQQRLVEQLGAAITAVTPPRGPTLYTTTALQQRLAWADGFLRFLKSARQPGDEAPLAAHHLDSVLPPLLQVFVVDPKALARTLEDSRL